MSIEQVKAAVLEFAYKNHSIIDSPESCGAKADKIAKVGEEVEQTPPFAKMIILRWPPEGVGEGRNFHYVATVQDYKQTIIFNFVKTTGFPKYVGPIKEAPEGSRFSEMVVAEKVTM